MAPSVAHGNLTVPRTRTVRVRGSTELCSLWPNPMELAAGRTQNYGHPIGNL